MHSFLAPTRVRFGDGSSREASKELGELGARRVLVVSGAGRTASSAGLSAILADMDKAGIEYLRFARAEADPSIETVARGAAEYRSSRCDAILAFGGGSPIDCAKGIGAEIAEGKPIRDFIGTGRAFTAPLPPLVAVPTTAGTGSEVTSAAVFTFEEDGRRVKKGTAGATLFPKLAFVDPELQATMPPELTAATGMDALTHAVEAYLSTSHNPMADPLCLESIRLIGRHLRRAVRKGADMEARRAMAMASSLAGIALSQSGLGMVHGYAHALGALAGLAHGLANAIMLPYVAQAYIPDANERLSDIGRALCDRCSATALDAVEEMADLGADIGIPSSLEEAGVLKELLPAIMADAATYKRRKQSPRVFTDAELERILYRAWSDSMAT